MCARLTATTLRRATLALLALVLAACAMPQLLSDSPAPAPPAGRTPPAVALTLVGVPPDQANILRDALSVAAGQRDVGIVEGSLQGGNYTLVGNFHAGPGGDGTLIDYTWELRDQDGVLVQSIADQATAPPAVAGEEWKAISPDDLRSIAEATAKVVAAKMQALGFAIRSTSLIMPPSYTFVAAGPGAAKEVDLETLNGPDAAAAPANLAAPPADTAAIAGDAIIASNLPSSDGSTPPSEGASKEKTGATAAADAGPPAAKGKVVIRAVAVVGVKGSPGHGNDELTAAMRRALTSVGWPVITEPRADALTIRGTVALAKAQSGQQNVKLRWVVETPRGKLLGDVRQANAVPAGSLDEGWGQAADVVAQAAATGIFDVIKKYR